MEIRATKRVARPQTEVITLDVSKTAAVVIDMWDTHPCKSFTARFEALIPRMNEVLSSLRASGATVCFAPAEVLPFYTDSAQRAATLHTPEHKQPSLVPFSPPLPPWAFHYCCECGPSRPCKYTRPWPWTRQHPDIAISDGDFIVDCNNNAELYNICIERGVTHLIYMGISVNVCLSWLRSCSIEKMTRLGLKCLLVRDLTIANTANGYDPQRDELAPAQTPDRATTIALKHIEQYYCPTMGSTELLQALRSIYRKGTADRGVGT
jgi:hypothetical protein